MPYATDSSIIVVNRLIGYFMVLFQQLNINSAAETEKLVARIKEMRNAYEILVGKLKGRVQLGDLANR
jgi:hypothetical protein